MESCRIENTEEESSSSDNSENPRRYPLNTIISEEVAMELGNYAKYFYCPKPNKEKHLGCEHLAAKEEMGDSEKPKNVKGNTHPTVKPVPLMEYLVKLVTPPSGICIDPFIGSGSTGIACSNLGFNFIGIEKIEKYYEFAKARINESINNNKIAA